MRKLKLGHNPHAFARPPHHPPPTYTTAKAGRGHQETHTKTNEPTNEIPAIMRLSRPGPRFILLLILVTTMAALVQQATADCPQCRNLASNIICGNLTPSSIPATTSKSPAGAANNAAETLTCLCRKQELFGRYVGDCVGNSHGMQCSSYDLQQELDYLSGNCTSDSFYNATPTPTPTATPTPTTTPNSKYGPIGASASGIVDSPTTNSTTDLTTKAGAEAPEQSDNASDLQAHEARKKSRIGAGVGGGVTGLLLLAAAGWALVRSHRQKKAARLRRQSAFMRYPDGIAEMADTSAAELDGGDTSSSEPAEVEGSHSSTERPVKIGE